MRIRNFIIAVLCCLGHVFVAHSQCVNGVSTNPNNPTNNSLPINPVYPNGDTRFLNKFDLLSLTPEGYLGNYELTNMVFGSVQLDYMINIWKQWSPYYSYINREPLPISKNGWELLLINLGRYPDNITPYPVADFKTLPYIVIYNRYSGTLRVFASIGTDHVVGEGADAIEAISGMYWVNVATRDVNVVKQIMLNK